MDKGTAASNGIGIGTALLLEENKIEVKVVKISDTAEELQRFRKSKDDFMRDIACRMEELVGKLGEQTAAILKNQEFIVNDSELNTGIENLILVEKICAEAAVAESCDMYIKMLSSVEDETIRQRAFDIEDVKARLLRILMGITEIDLTHLPPDTILVAHELPPSVTALMDTAHISGIVTEKGGDTSHAAIIARALAIPSVLNVKYAKEKIVNGDSIIVDGTSGSIFINPDIKTMEMFRQKQKEYMERAGELERYRNIKTLTQDNIGVMLTANIKESDDVTKMLDVGGDGVGLFRTEFLYMNGNSLPSEEEQFAAYKKAAVMAKGKPVVIRTLDIGGDKEIPYLGMAKERNPFLGYRAIRYCLGRPDVFMQQLRAILRASAYGDIKIMIPMVSTLREFTDVKSDLCRIKEELEQKNIPYNREIELGVMIETPSACLIADILAKEADFFSIGTNDLIQYTVAVDRDNENVAYLYSPFHPSVLRAIRHIIKCAKDEKIHVCMCGEAASDPDMIPLLLAFGLEEFSVSSAVLLETRKNIASWSLMKAGEIADNVMKMSTVEEIQDYYKYVYETRK